MATEVQKAESALPALVTTPALEITAEDIALPRIYIGQFMSDAVKEGYVKAGSIYSATGSDDPDPQVLAAADKNGVDRDNGVIVHVLALRKGKSFSDGGELQLYDYDDPSAPKEAWITYNYTVCLPEHDEDVPYKWLLTRTGKQAAQKINTVLKKNEGAGPAYANAFKFNTARRENAKGEFYVAQITPVPADPKHVEIAERLAVLVSGQSSDFGSNNEEPNI